MNLDTLNKLLFGVFALFMLFSAIVLLVGDYLNDPLFSIIIFIVILYLVYYFAIKFFMKD